MFDIFCILKISFCRNFKNQMSRSSISVPLPTQLTRDETRILEECDRESLIYRSLPLSILSVYVTQYAMTKNLISIKAKWFKLGLGLFTGYLIGKISYASACRKKILSQIPDSSLAQLILGVESPQTSTTNVINSSSSIDVNQYGDPIYKNK